MRKRGNLRSRWRSSSTALRVAGPRLRHVARVETVFRDCPPVRGDEPKLVQALVNLLVNAGQAVEERAGQGRITIATGTTLDGDTFVSVSDNGAGIAPDHLARLWEPYFTTRMDRGGLGLGLFVTRGIADAHGGRLDVTSDPDRLTTLTLSLPPGREPFKAPAPVPPSPARPAEPVGTLLLVDDVSNSLARNSYALIALARLKNKDDYTYLHSFAVCALMVALARTLGLMGGLF